MIFNETEILSRDLAAAIRHYSFNNLAGFYKRFKTSLNMCHATFYKAMLGNNCDAKHIRSIEALVKRLNLGDNRTGSSLLAKKYLYRELIRVLDEFLSYPDMEHLDMLREFVDKNKPRMLE